MSLRSGCKWQRQWWQRELQESRRQTCGARAGTLPCTATKSLRHESQPPPSESSTPFKGEVAVMPLRRDFFFRRPAPLLLPQLQRPPRLWSQAPQRVVPLLRLLHLSLQRLLHPYPRLLYPVPQQRLRMCQSHARRQQQMVRLSNPRSLAQCFIRPRPKGRLQTLKMPNKRNRAVC